MQARFDLAGRYGAAGVVGLLGALSDATLNKWAQTQTIGWLLLAYGLWILVATLLGLMLRSHSTGFSVAVVAFLLANIGFAVVFDHLWFGQRLTIVQWLGILCAFVAVLLLEPGRRKAGQ